MIEFKNGFYADVRTEDRSRTVISYTDGILQEMKTSVECRAFLRVYDGRMWYYASVTDLAHLQKTLDGLYAAATPNAQILDDPVVRRFERNRDTALRFADCSVCDIPAGEKQALLLSYLPYSRRIPASPRTKAYILTATACSAFSPVSERISHMIIRPADCPSRAAWRKEKRSSRGHGRRARPASTSLRG